MISAILLAAGESKRMGNQNKLLLPFRGRTMVENIVDTLGASQVDQVIVVLGHEADQVKYVLGDRPVQLVYNQHYPQGMTSSIQCGVKAADPNTQGLMICLSDLPRIQVEDVNYLLEHFQQSVWAKDPPPNSPLQKLQKGGDRSIIIPTFQGQRGHPVIFSSEYQSEILAHSDPNGCQGIIKRYSQQVLEVQMDSDRCLKDIDTWWDYNNFRLIRTQ
jgi:molybdenum cofactor cytidylyltransferase